MKILPPKKNDKTYSCHSYLLLGDWNRVEDINTLIDPGVDGFVLGEIEHLATSFGKVAIEQIILTHNHCDHAAGILAVNGYTREYIAGLRKPTGRTIESIFSGHDAPLTQRLQRDYPTGLG